MFRKGAVSSVSLPDSISIGCNKQCLFTSFYMCLSIISLFKKQGAESLFPLFKNKVLKAFFLEYGSED